MRKWAIGRREFPFVFAAADIDWKEGVDDNTLLFDTPEEAEAFRARYCGEPDAFVVEMNFAYLTPQKGRP